MQIQLTEQFLDLLRDNIRRQDEVALLHQMGELYPVDLAEIFNEISPLEAKYLYKLLDEEKAAEVITELDEDVREKFLALLSPKEIAVQFVENLDSDDAADILGELDEDRQKEVISSIEDIDVANDVVDLLKYDEDTAGGLMAKELVKVNIHWDRHTAIDEIRNQASEIDNLYTVYVVNENGILLGLLPLKKLLLEPESASIEDIYVDKIVIVDAFQRKEEVANLMKKYDMVVLPVVDALGRLIGRITIDDVVDVIQEEAERDYQLASGISADVESDDSVWVITRARMPWLLVGLAGGILGSQVIASFEEQLRIKPEMAYFITLIAAMGGNSGVQSSAIVVQALANKSLRPGNLLGKLMKELAIGLLNGMVCALAIALYNVFVNKDVGLSITVGTAMLVVVVTASLFGTFIPLMLNRFKIDPALATGPFVTTMNDITGMLIYFSIGRLMYGLF